MIDHIGTALQNIRCYRGMAEERLAALLAERAGETVTPEYVSKVEQGLSRVSQERLALICGVLGCLPSQVTKLAELIAPGADEAEFAELLSSLSPLTA